MAEIDFSEFHKGPINTKKTAEKIHAAISAKISEIQNNEGDQSKLPGLTVLLNRAALLCNALQTKHSKRKNLYGGFPEGCFNKEVTPS